MGKNIKNEAGIDESNKYGSDMVRKALYDSGYGGRKSPGKSGVLSMGQGQTIRNDEGISEKNKFGEQRSSKVDSLTDYYGKHAGDLKAGKAKQTIQNDEGISNSDKWGKGSLYTKEMEYTKDYGKSGVAVVKSVKIPHEAIFGRELIQGKDYTKKNEMGHDKPNDEDGINDY